MYYISIHKFQSMRVTNELISGYRTHRVVLSHFRSSFAAGHNDPLDAEKKLSKLTYTTCMLFTVQDLGITFHIALSMSF